MSDPNMPDLSKIETNATAAVQAEIAAADDGLKTDAAGVAGFVRRCGWYGLAVVAIVAAVAYVLVR